MVVLIDLWETLLKNKLPKSGLHYEKDKMHGMKSSLRKCVLWKISEHNQNLKEEDSMENQVKVEKSCGCIIIDNEKILLVKQTKGFWSFPKGHMESGETEVQTAIREVKEETNIDVIPDENKRYVEEYMMENGNKKQVVYFVAKKTSADVKAQESEIADIKWLNFKDAYETISYDNMKELILKVLSDNGYKM